MAKTTDEWWQILTGLEGLHVVDSSRSFVGHGGGGWGEVRLLFCMSYTDAKMIDPNAFCLHICV